MKRAVLALFGLCLPLQVFGQGTISFNNYRGDGSPFAPVYGPEAINPQQQKWGNAAGADPVGTQTYSGAPLKGTNYSVEGWYSLTPVSNVYALNSTASPAPGSLTTFNIGAGFFISYSFIPDSWTNGMSAVYLQVRAWDNGGGQYSSWTEAWEAAMAGSGKAVGWSKVFWQQAATGAAPPDGLSNFESFNIFIVPEPSTVTLLGLRIIALLLFRWRN